MSSCISPRVRGAALVSSWLLCALIAGCGGGGGSTPTTKVGGTAAVGNPLVNASVTLRCNTSTAYTATTGSVGQWERALPTAELPCAVRVSGGTVGSGSGAPANAQVLYSVTTGNGTEVTVNLTPLTSLVLARAHGAPLDDSWFEGLDRATRQQLLSNLDAAISALATALAGYDLPAGFAPFDVSFSATSGNPYDDLLEQLGAAIEAANSSLEAQLAEFASNGALPPPAGDGGDTDPPANNGDLPDTTLPADVSGVRLATRGIVGGDVQNDTVRTWVGSGGIDVGAVPGILHESYLVISSPFSSFGLRNLPNEVGTYACGDSLGQTNPRNIELGYAVGQGYSSVGTSGVTGFQCSITVTRVGSAGNGTYAGLLEGHFTARLFKTGAPVNLATSVLVSGHFRLGGN